MASLSPSTEHQLFLGDCLGPDGLATLADGSVGCAIFDPPYSERVHKRLGQEGRNDGTAARDALSFEYLTRDVAFAVARELCRVTRRWIIPFCDELSFGLWVDAVEAAGGEYVRKGTWIKVDPMPQMSGDRPSTGTEELVISHAARTSGRMRWNGGGRAAVYPFNPQERDVKRQYPAQKPVALMEALVRDFTDPGELVLDPYAGSGTTGVACKRLGRQFIGWERDPKFHAAAVRRLDATREQLGLPGLRGPKAKQGALL